MIETPTDAAGTVARLTLERELAAHAALIDRVRGMVAEASGQGSKLVVASGATREGGWQGLASRAFAIAAANLTRELGQIDDHLLSARQLVDAARFEVTSGV